MVIDLLRAEVLIGMRLAFGHRQSAQLHRTVGLGMNAAAVQGVAVRDLPVDVNAVRAGRACRDLEGLVRIEEFRLVARRRRDRRG